MAYYAFMLGFVPKALFLKGPNQFITANELYEVEDMIRRGEISYILCPLEYREGKPGTISQQVSEDTGVSILYVSLFSMTGCDNYFWFMERILGEIEVSMIYSGAIYSMEYELFLYFAVGILATIALIELFIIYKQRKEVEVDLVEA